MMRIGTRAPAVAVMLAFQVTAVIGAIQIQPIVTGLVEPVFVTSARDGTGRLFIVEQGGLIQVLEPGSISPTVFLDLRDRVKSDEPEQGLLGLAFHPDFSLNGRFFVNYTRRKDGYTVIAAFRVSAGNPDVGRPREHRLLAIPQPAPNHNGGMLAFGPDGYLYAGMGDGGFGNDPGGRAQDLGTLLGKMLRIDVDHRTEKRRYGIPRDNPFVGQRGAGPIWALGFRNPWRWSFDRITGELWLGDVGQDSKEEIDLVGRGGNYGWRIFEGSECTGIEPVACGQAGFIGPVDEYDTHVGGRCAVTGGYV